MTSSQTIAINTVEQHQGDNVNQQFRYYSRQVLKTPGDIVLHQKRIDVARSFTLNEPLQGALADMFYGCWFEIPYSGTEILNALSNRLTPRLYTAFQVYIQKQLYMQPRSELATRWSVLVTPSLNVADHHLRISSDDARQIAQRVVSDLLQAKNQKNDLKLKNIEEEFLAHCIGCFDRIGFSIVWFRLAKQGWQFDEPWIKCQKYLEITNS